MCLAVPGRVLRITARDGTLMADVDFGGVHKEVCLQYVPHAAVDEYGGGHVGFAIQLLDEEAARQTLANFERLGILAAEFDELSPIAANPVGVITQPTGEES